MIRIVLGRNKMVDRFTVQDAAEIAGHWEEIVRYDNAHENPNVHRFWSSEAIRELDATRPIHGLIADAIQDLQENWAAYRRSWERAHR